MDGDIFKAYDHTRHAQMVKALDAKRVPRIITAAWLREFRRSRTLVSLDEDTKTSGIGRTRSLPQGDPAAPALFHCALDIVASEFLSIARQQNRGLPLSHGDNVSLMLFADNFWLVATSAKQLSAMMIQWIRLLHGAGWRVPLSECTWCTWPRRR